MPIPLRAARRLALARAGLLAQKMTGAPVSARGGGPSRGASRDAAARAAAHRVIDRFGYLQLDTISVAGARSHTLVLLSRLEGMDPALGESLLVPGEPLFEYWGHEASWLPIDLYPLFAWRRERFRRHPWWGDVIGPRRAQADELLRRARDHGGFRSTDLEGERSGTWWGGKDSKRLAEALWSAGELAIRERRGFQRIYDLPERVIPDEHRTRQVSVADSCRALILRAMEGHGWAETRTIAATWRFRTTNPDFRAAMTSLAEDGSIVPCDLVADVADVADVAVDAAPRPGWIRPADLELAARLERLRPAADRGVLLSPFDPVLWDRARLLRLFGFDLKIEIYTPAPKRRYGYYSMPVLAGDRLVGRVDVKADRPAGLLRTPSRHFESRRPSAADRAAMTSAIARHAAALGLDVARG